jgi:hypothetical protein
MEDFMRIILSTIVEISYFLLRQGMCLGRIFPLSSASNMQLFSLYYYSMHCLKIIFPAIYIHLPESVFRPARLETEGSWNPESHSPQATLV